MPKATALRSFDHNGPCRKGDTVEFDRITMDALRRSRLVGPDLDEGSVPAKVDAPKAPVPTVGSLGKAPKPKTGKKSAASPAAPASPQQIAPPPMPGVLPPPLPVV